MAYHVPDFVSEYIDFILLEITPKHITLHRNVGRLSLEVHVKANKSDTDAICQLQHMQLTDNSGYTAKCRESSRNRGKIYQLKCLQVMLRDWPRHWIHPWGKAQQQLLSWLPKYKLQLNVVNKAKQ